MSHEYARIIVDVALSSIREAPSKTYISRRPDDWREGRISACAAMYPTIENIAAENEARFLIKYHTRHGVYQ